MPLNLFPPNLPAYICIKVYLPGLSAYPKIQAARFRLLRRLLCTELPFLYRQQKDLTAFLRLSLILRHFLLQHHLLI